MNKAKILLAAGLLLTGMAMHAEDVEGLIVNDGATVQQFPISAIREIKFSDSGLAVVKTDDFTVEFSSDWQISFGMVENTGIPGISVSEINTTARIFDTEGKLVKETPMSEIRINELPKGVYIIMCNGKSLKIVR